MKQDDQMVGIGTSRDRYSVLIPCYGFGNSREAAAYTSGPWIRECRIMGTADAFCPLAAGHRTYVARMSARHGVWLVNNLINQPTVSADKPIWAMLRNRDTPKPDACHVALLLEGKRHFSRHLPHSLRNPYRVSEGDGDCFAAWTRTDGTAINDTVDVGGSPDSRGAIRIYAVRAGRGVIYSQERRFDDRGNPCGWIYDLVRIEFSILDRHHAKDDMLRVGLMHDFLVNKKDSVALEANLRLDDASWRPLIRRARMGFDMTCRPKPQEVEKGPVLP